MADSDGLAWGWVLFIFVMVLVGPCIAVAPECGPRVVPAERWPTFGVNRVPRWRVEDLAPLDIRGQELFLLHDRYEQRRGGGYADARVDRVTVFDRATGDKLGQTHAYDRIEVAAVQGERLWIRVRGEVRALSLPRLQREAVLDDLLADHPELGGAPDAVHFPSDTDNVRLVMPDGFLWDLQPDLATVERLHHDTAVPSTPSFGVSASRCPQQAALDSGRTALLGTHSHRPALRVTDQRHAVEAEEVHTEHDGFLDGAFLCLPAGAPVLRPDEHVFIVHAEDVAGERRALVSRVSMSGGLVWTRATRDWLPAGLPDAAGARPAWVEDRSDTLLMWVRTHDDVAASQALVLVDPQTGEARWSALP